MWRPCNRRLWAPWSLVFSFWWQGGNGLLTWKWQWTSTLEVSSGTFVFLKEISFCLETTYIRWYLSQHWRWFTPSKTKDVPWKKGGWKTSCFRLKWALLEGFLPWVPWVKTTRHWVGWMSCPMWCWWIWQRMEPWILTGANDAWIQCRSF